MRRVGDLRSKSMGVLRLRGEARVSSEGFESAITVPDSEAIGTEGRGSKINCTTEVTLLRIH